MKKWIACACSVSMLGTGLATSSSAESSAAQDASPPVRIGDYPPPYRSFCRSPAALPELGPEQENKQGRDPRRMHTRSKGVGDYPESAPPPPPPPPSSAPPPPADLADDGVVVTGSRVAEPVYESAAPVAVVGGESDRSYTSPPTLPRPPISPVPPPPPVSQPAPQAGLLTAGEHDDLLNPELYEEYRRKAGLGQRTGALPLVDTGRMLTVEVKDNRGRAVPFAEVELRCSDGNAIKLKTVADGKVVFFPALDRLSQDIWLRAEKGDWRPVRLTDASGGQTIKITQSGRANSIRKLDLALVVDVTGSMSDELRYLQSELTAIIGDLKRRHRNLDVRVAMTFYRDQGDEFVTRSFGFDGNVERARSRLSQQYANGGGDYEEAMQDALIRAASLDWRDDAAKSLLLVADAPPHDRDLGKAWVAAEHLRKDRVHIVPVGASGVGDMAEYVMRAMAAATQSRYTFLTDDSGIGNPHAKPAIDCYLVTRLDHLLRRVIDSQISGRRIEPDSNEIIRSVGDYDAGRCVLPDDFGQ